MPIINTGARFVRAMSERELNIVDSVTDAVMSLIIIVTGSIIA